MGLECYKRKPRKTLPMLSDDLLVQIFKRLELPDLLRARAVSRRWRRVCNDRRLWYTLSFEGNVRATSEAIETVCRVTPCLQYLTRLNLARVHGVTEACVRAIPRAACAATLTAVNLSRCSGSTDKSVVELSRCPSLRELRLAYCRLVTRKSVRILAARCPALQVLDLTCISGVRDSLLHVLAASCKDLRELSVANARSISDQGLSSIAKSCTRLRILNLNWCTNITDISVRECAARMPFLCEIGLADTQITDNSIVDLATRCSQLHTFHLSRCSDFTDIGLNAIIDNLGTQIVEVTIANCQNVSDYCVERLLLHCEQLHTADVSKLPPRPVTPLLDELSRRGVQVYF